MLKLVVECEGEGETCKDGGEAPELVRGGGGDICGDEVAVDAMGHEWVHTACR